MIERNDRIFVKTHLPWTLLNTTDRVLFNAFGVVARPQQGQWQVFSGPRSTASGRLIVSHPENARHVIAADTMDQTKPSWLRSLEIILAAAAPRQELEINLRDFSVDPFQILQNLLHKTINVGPQRLDTIDVEVVSRTKSTGSMFAISADAIETKTGDTPFRASELARRNWFGITAAGTRDTPGHVHTPLLVDNSQSPRPGISPRPMDGRSKPGSRPV